MYPYFNPAHTNTRQPTYCLVLFLLISSLTGCAHTQLPIERLGAVGIGVSDLTISSEFYQQVLGLKLLRTYELGYLDELVLGYKSPKASQPNAAVVVLMHWPEDPHRQYGSGELKLVFYVDDPKAVLERIRQRGGVIDREATPHPALNGGLVGLARDPDNYIIEILQR